MMEDLKLKARVLRELSNIVPEILDTEIDFTITQFKSKKNLVYEVNFLEKPKNSPKSMVIKHFKTSNAEKEYKVLKKLQSQDLWLPKIIFFKDPILALEKIDGDNLTNYINFSVNEINSLNDLDAYTHDRLIFAIKKLADWIARLHKQNILEWKALKEVIVLNKGDTRLRDFVISSLNDEVYGFDFEDSYEGNYLDDLAWICCALLDTNPGIFEMTEPKPKIELLNIFLREYYRFNINFPFNFDYFAEKLIENLNEVIERRRLDFGSISKAAILSKIAKDF